MLVAENVNLDDLVFKAMADSRRRRIMDFLRERPMTTSEICGLFPELDRCTVMQHLGVLVRAEIVLVRREGRYRTNVLNLTPLIQVQRRWLGSYLG